jgi:chemotaxis protein methyltransferase CheR
MAKPTNTTNAEANGPEASQAPRVPLISGQLVEMLEANYGLRLSSLTNERLGLALEQLAASLGLEVSSLSPLLEQQIALQGRLARLLAIHETYFFRVKPQMDTLRQVILPKMLHQRRLARRLRLWSAGCSSGEEAYTLVMLLAQHFPYTNDWEIEVLASDLDEEVIAQAESGEYGLWSFRGTMPELRAQAFEALPGNPPRWRLQPHLRQRVRFFAHNLITDPAPADLDLVLCRNVTIYFSHKQAQALNVKLANSLRPGGFLLLGPSDPQPQTDNSSEHGLQAHWHQGSLFWQRSTRSSPNSPRPGEQKPAQWAAPTPPALPAPLALPAPPPTPVSPPSAQPAPTTSPATSPAANTSLDPTHLVAEGLQLLELGQGALALQVLRQAVFLAPNDALGNVALARAFAQNGDDQRARRLLLHARRLLAALASDQVLTSGDDLFAVGELREVVDGLLR